MRFEMLMGAATGVGTATGGGEPQSVGQLAAVERVRNVFPETWLWSNHTVG